jgi:GntR family colanic acid and biofilm gene transcriptional regulator
LQIGPTLNYLYPQPAMLAEGAHNYDRLLAAMDRRDAAAVRAAIDRAIEEGNAILLTKLSDGGFAMAETAPVSIATL